MQRARGLRKSQTDTEQKLWQALRDRRLANVKFSRQIPVDKFIVDFICRSAKLIVEVDGGQHDINSAKDLSRTRMPEALGYRVVRFWNNEVLNNLDGVLTVILLELGVDPTAPSPCARRRMSAFADNGERAGGEGLAKKETKSC